MLQLLTEQKMLTSKYGRTSSVAVLLFQDLAVVPLLALASLLTLSDLTIGEDKDTNFEPHAYVLSKNLSSIAVANSPKVGASNIAAMVMST